MSEIPADLEAQYAEEYGFDPWETSSGLPDQITIRVQTPHFGYDSEFQDGTVPLFILEGTIIAGGDEGSTEFSQWYTVGKGWEPSGKGGTRLAPEKGKKRRLNNQTNYAHLFASLRDAAAKQGLENELRHRGDPFSAALWDGLELYMEREEYQMEIGGEKRQGSRLVVSSIEKMPGVAEAKTTSTPTDSAPTQAPAPVAAAAPTEGDVPLLSPKIKVSLRKLAEQVKASGGTHSQFAEQAFSDVDGVLDNTQAEDAVMDQTAGGIWASA